VPLIVERSLIDVGHDVVAVQNTMPGARDESVLKMAVQEDRILLTFDRDFGELIFRTVARPAPTTVYMRGRMAPQVFAARIVQAMEHVEPGYFLVVNAKNIRKRRIL
jgi:predicted nuclease of predicted toxin-antitoxin system